MMTRTLQARCAPLAIAAFLALPATIAHAQEAAAADPVIVLPPAQADPVAPASSAPVDMAAVQIVLPAVESSQPSVARVNPTLARPATRPANTAATAALAPSVQKPSVLDVSSVAPSSAPVPVVARNTSQPLTPASADLGSTAIPVAVRTTDTNETALAAMLGLLGLAAVGAVAVGASRRRRRPGAPATRLTSPELDIDSGRPGLAKVGGPVLDRAPQPDFAALPAYTQRAAVETVAVKRETAINDPVVLPDAVPATFEERDALLKELIAAEPDRANPFHAPGARARRAKLIIQSLGRTFETRKPRFDLSQYAHRWPALRGWNPATA